MPLIDPILKFPGPGGDASLNAPTGFARLVPLRVEQARVV